jgi:hypothetical protein
LTKPLTPRKSPSSSILLFLEKEAKSISSASQKIWETKGFRKRKSRRVVFFFFQKKKQKALVLLRRRSRTHAFPETERPSSGILLFPEKEAKSVSSASQKDLGAQKIPRSGTTGVWGLAPKKRKGCERVYYK